MNTDSRHGKIAFEIGPKDIKRSELLISPTKWHLGGAEPDFKKDRLRVTLGNSPVAVDLRKLYERSGREFPTDLDIYSAFRIWMVSYSVGVIQEGGWARLNQVGLKVSYGAEASQRIVILDVLPRTEFVHRVGGSISCNTAISVDGHAEAPEAIKSLLEDCPFGIDGKVSLSLDAGFVGKLSFSLVTPKVTAIGAGNTAGEWLITRHENPLVGTHRFVHLILVPGVLNEIVVGATVYGTVGGYFRVPVRFEVPEQSLTCSIRPTE